jgi:hypothetical protein
MQRLFCIVIILCLNTGVSFSQSSFGTNLGRICEFDAANAKGLMDTGNFIITSEEISYSVDANGGRDVSYRYKIKKLTQTRNNTFGLSLRRRGMDGYGDYPVNTLNVFVNNRLTQVTYVKTSYDGHHYDDNGNLIPLEIDWEGEEGWEMNMVHWFTAYKGWYYFDADFSVSGDTNIEISYRTVLDGTGIQYDSHPFWLPVSNNAEFKVTIENNYNENFIYSITDCRPTEGLISENWKLEKPKQNTIEITYIPVWHSQNKLFYIKFSSLYRPYGSPHYYFFDIIHYDNNFQERLSTGSGVYLMPYSYYGDRWSDNISRRELMQYEFIFLNRGQLRIMRNAFYAVYKYRFNDNLLNEIFYEPYLPVPDYWFNTNFSGRLLSPIERRNIEIIQNLENRME